MRVSNAHTVLHSKNDSPSPAALKLDPNDLPGANCAANDPSDSARIVRERVRRARSVVVLHRPRRVHPWIVLRQMALPCEPGQMVVSISSRKGNE